MAFVRNFLNHLERKGEAYFRGPGAKGLKKTVVETLSTAHPIVSLIKRDPRNDHAVYFFRRDGHHKG